MTMDHVARTTNTSDLVVSLYLYPRLTLTRGSAYVQRWIHRSDFHTKRGVWSFTAHLDPPEELPTRFKLIRLLFDPRKMSYPKSEIDRYGWKFTFETFYDHLALLFAHELHHYRRYHLMMHPGEGEQSANRWALKYVNDLGYGVTGIKRIRAKAKPSRSQKQPFPVPHERFFRFQSLRAGDYLIINHDPRSRYIHQTVKVVRPIRSNSKRIVIQTADGESWRWPMQWLEFTVEQKT